MEYIAFIHKEADQFVAVIPDLNYVSSFGDGFVEAVHNIKEAAELYCEDLALLPKPSTLNHLITQNNELKSSIPQLIDIRIEKLKRINITMRSDIIELLPRRLAEFNGNRSAYLQSLVISDLKNNNIAVS